MKLITKFIIFLFIIVLNNSCNDYMELLPPRGLVRDQFWNTKEEVKQVLLGAYTTFAQMDELLFKYGEMRADMVTGLQNLPENEEKITEGNIYSDNELCNWIQFYEVINYCNEVIKNGPEVLAKDNTFTDFQLKGYLSEAYFLRSLSYFYMVRIFKDVPLVLDPSESDDQDFYLPKTDGDTILNHIINDLITYRMYASPDGFSTIAESKGRATRAAFDALLADIYLWKFDYVNCIKHIEYIESPANTVQFQLMPMDRWFELFYPGNSLESIFEFQFNPEKNEKNGTSGITSRYSYMYGPSRKAGELFKAESLSPEKKRGEKVSVKKNGVDDYTIWKYIGRAPDGITERAGTEQAGCNWIVYRYADVMLMKAEALSQLERYTESREILQLIHERAGFTSTIILADSKTAYEDRILEERSLELAFEGKRWFDLLRMGRRNNYSRKSKLVEIIVQNFTSSQKRILAIKLTNPLGWYMPIFKTEIERNKNLLQNPFYKTNL